MSKKLMNTGVAAAAVAVIAIGAFLLGSSQSDSTASTANTGAVSAHRDGHGFGPRAGMGTEVSGDAAAKVEQAVAAKYDGTIERVQQLPDGSYLAHVMTNDGEVYVTVSKSFEVTGTQQGPQRGMPPGTSAPGSQSGTNSTTS